MDLDDAFSDLVSAFGNIKPVSLKAEPAQETPVVTPQPEI